MERRRMKATKGTPRGERRLRIGPTESIPGRCAGAMPTRRAQLILSPNTKGLAPLPEPVPGSALFQGHVRFCVYQLSAFQLLITQR